MDAPSMVMRKQVPSWKPLSLSAPVTAPESCTGGLMPSSSFLFLVSIATLLTVAPCDLIASKTSWIPYWRCFL